MSDTPSPPPPPPSSPPPLAQAKPIFLAVRGLPPHERDEALDRLCPGDPTLRRVVEMLLAGEEAPLRFETLAEEIIAAREALSDRGDPSAAGPSDSGTRIGPYRVLEKIGEGGFGIVYMAEQEEPVRRRVALKILKLGMDTRQIVARFEAERQALAIMDHPAIARVFDAGATRTGRPFFVMELVGGEPITTFCDRRAFTIVQRLELFGLVCDGVQHAHQKGVIHRDLKPGNILVAEVDGGPVPKIIDFGIAKAISEPLTAKTFFTEHGQFIGTPEYISPEQAAGSQDIDTRSDVYSLGVLLYELLVGSTPFTSQELRSAAFGEIQRLIREVDPPKPSTRLSKASDSRADVATRRQTPPDRLDRTIRGDLDWIVMRAIDKDRARRYDSAGALAMDIQRHLDNEPVVAAPPGTAYRLRKFVTRHKLGVAAGSAVALTLIAGIIGTSTGLVWAMKEREAATLAAAAEATQREIAQANEQIAMDEAARAEREKAEAQTARDRAELVASFMSDMFAGVGPSFARGRDTTMLRELMDWAVDRIEAGELKAAPSAELVVRGNIGTICTEIVAYERGMTMLEPAVELARTLHPDDHEAVAASLFNLGALVQARGDLERAEQLFRESLEMRQRLYSGNHRLVASSMCSLGYVMFLRGTAFDGELTIAKAANMHRSAKPQDTLGLIHAFNTLSVVVRERGDYTQALVAAQSALGITKAHFSGDHPTAVTALVNMAAASEGLSDSAGAERYLFQARQIDQRLRQPPPEAATAVAAGPELPPKGHRDPEGAERILRQNLERSRKANPGDSPLTANNLQNLALIVKDRGDAHEAESLLNECLEMRRRLYPNGHNDTISALRCLAVLARDHGNLTNAEKMYREMLDVQTRMRPGAQATSAATMFDLGLLLEQKGDLIEAESFYRRSLQMSKQLWVIAPQIGNSAYRLALLLQQRGDLAKAEPLAAEAVKSRRQTATAGHATLLASIRLHAEVLSALAREVEAEPLWRELVDSAMRHGDGRDPQLLPAARTGLGKCLLAQAQFAAAELPLLAAHADLGSVGEAAGGGELRLACVSALCDLYVAWDKAEPGRGHDVQSARWNSERENLRSAPPKDGPR